MRGFVLVCFISLTCAVDLQTTRNLMQDFYKTVSTPVKRLQNLYRSNFAPTLWCGIRDAAPFPEALSAIYPHLDNCCRSHDMCPLQIERGKCFENICNPSFLTPILSCDCESEFRECLKSLPSAASLPDFPITWFERLLTDLTGIGYFGILPRILEHKCVLKTHPEPKCKTWNYKSHTCQEHETGKEDSKPSWSLISLHRDFNHRDWFRPENYINDIVDTRQLEEFFSKFSTANDQLIEQDEL